MTFALLAIWYGTNVDDEIELLVAYLFGVGCFCVCVHENVRVNVAAVSPFGTTETKHIEPKKSRNHFHSQNIEQKFFSFLTFNVCVYMDWNRKSQMLRTTTDITLNSVVTIRQQNGRTTSLPICSFCINLKRSTFKDSTKLNQTDKNR